MTLYTFRSVLLLALGRNGGLSLDEVAERFLPRFLWLQQAALTPVPMMVALGGSIDRPLDLSEPSTLGAVKAALTLALGCAPGVLGSGCALLPIESDDPAELHAWRLITCSGTVDFTEFDGGRSPSGDLRIVRVPGITRELNVAQALEMASAQVLAASAPLVPVEGWRSPTYPEGVFYPTGYKPIAEIGRDGIVWLAWSRCPEAADWMVGDNWRNTPEIPWPFQAANNGTASRDALKAALRGLGFGIVHNARR